MNKFHSFLHKTVVMLAVALPLGFSSCSLQNYYAASKCNVSLPGNDLSKSVTGIYLDATQLQLSTPLTAGLTILNKLSSPQDFPLTMGVDLQVYNPGKVDAKIGRFDVSLTIDSNGDKKFTENERVEVVIYANTHPQDVVKSRSDDPKRAFKTNAITVPAGTQKVVPVVIIIPNLKTQFQDQTLLTTLYKSAINNDRSRLQLKVRPYIGNIALSPWIEIK